MSLRLAVIGDPVAHSASPALHRAFLTETGLTGSYEAIRVSAGEGASAIAGLRARGYAGLNVTTPLKEEAFACAAIHDAAALASRAVNTLVFGEPSAGYNTDGIGVLGALADGGLLVLAGARVLVLGAGPTARAAVAALVAAGAIVTVWNRTGTRARDLAADLAARLWEGPAAFDAAFAALPSGVRLGDGALETTLRETPLVIDANYGARATLGALLGRPDVRDGATMLQVGARAAFEHFRTAHR